MFTLQGYLSCVKCERSSGFSLLFHFIHGQICIWPNSRNKRNKTTIIIKMKNDKWDYNKISFVESVTQTQYSLIIIVLSNRNAMCDNVLSKYLVILNRMCHYVWISFTQNFIFNAMKHLLFSFLLLLKYFQ